MQIADELPLTCRIELWLPFAHVGHTADDIFRSVRFRYESFRARFDGAFTVLFGLSDVRISTCGGSGSMRS